ncbi:uncharacterized protein LOC126963092 [Macaca thibetana thibetana]|nr:uncharacterized protein LOC105478375 isoform X2 [Macaca nemestrina]XP_050661009.1 uncharacterized protein LOC126963092 [Macaca thibetana thibetana]
MTAPARRSRSLRPGMWSPKGWREPQPRREAAAARARSPYPGHLWKPAHLPYQPFPNTAVLSLPPLPKNPIVWGAGIFWTPGSPICLPVVPLLPSNEPMGCQALEIFPPILTMSPFCQRRNRLRSRCAGQHHR